MNVAGMKGHILVLATGQVSQGEVRALFVITWLVLLYTDGRFGGQRSARAVACCCAPSLNPHQPRQRSATPRNEASLTNLPFDVVSCLV